MYNSGVQTVVFICMKMVVILLSGSKKVIILSVTVSASVFLCVGNFTRFSSLLSLSMTH